MIVAWAVVVALVVLVAANIVLVPWLRLQQQRREALLHMPQPEEYWVQWHAEGPGRDLLYIHHTDDHGLVIWAMSAGAREPVRWRESWQQWSVRLQTNTVLFTGQRGPLGDA